MQGRGNKLRDADGGAGALALARERIARPAPPNLIPLPAAAERIGVASATLRAAVERGEIVTDATHLHHRIDVEEQSLLAWARSKKLVLA